LCIYLPALYNGAVNRFLIPSFGNISDWEKCLENWELFMIGGMFIV